MRTAGYVLVLGIAALTLNVCEGAPDPIKIVKNIPETKPFLSITKFTVARQGANIRVDIAVKYSGGKVLGKNPTLTGDLTLFRSNNGKWENVTSGPISVKPDQQFPVSLTMPGKGGLFFKLEVRTHGKAELAVAQRQVPKQQFVVQYRDPNWKKRQFAQANVRNELIGASARAFAQGLADLGYETKIKYTHRHDEWIIDSYDEYTQEVSFRCLGQERVFNTEAAARAFMNRLPGGAERKLELR